MAPRKQIDEATVEQLISAYQDGLTMQGVAAAYHVSQGTVAAALKIRGLRAREAAPRRLNAAQEEQVAARWMSRVSLAHIMQEFGVCAWTIQAFVKRAGLPPRPVGAQTDRLSDADIATIEELAKTGLSQKAIGQRIGRHQSTVGNYCRAHQLETKRHPQARGSEHGAWKGGRTIDPHGYLHVNIPIEHPFRIMAGPDGYVREHRLIMAESLGRPLDRYETVHHLNGDKLDNRLENLQLRQGNHGSGGHYVCADCGSHNVVARRLGES